MNFVTNVQPGIERPIALSLHRQLVPAGQQGNIRGIDELAGEGRHWYHLPGRTVQHRQLDVLDRQAGCAVKKSQLDRQSILSRGRHQHHHHQKKSSDGDPGKTVGNFHEKTPYHLGRL